MRPKYLVFPTALLVAAVILSRKPASDARAPDPAANTAPSRGPRFITGETVAPSDGSEERSSPDSLTGTRLSGVVYKTDGTPAGGALVAVDSLQNKPVTAESDGTFHMDGLPRRRLQVVASLGDHLAGPVAVDATRDSSAQLVLGPGASLAVNVVRASDRAPIRGALVELATYSKVTGETDAGGNVVLKPLLIGQFPIRAVAPGFAPTETVVGVQRTRDTLTLSLDAAAIVQGRVLNGDGQPVEGSQVSVEEEDAQAGRGVMATTTSASDGAWSLTVASNGKLLFRAWHDGFGVGQTGYTTSKNQGSGRPVIITLTGAGSVSGVVLDGASAPMAGATVQAAAGAVTREVLTNADGSFRVGGLPRTKVRFVASAGDAVSDGMVVDLSAVSLKEHVALILERTEGISGLVVDEQGGAVGGVTVHCRAELAPHRGARSADASLVSVRTAADGSFAIRGLATGRYRLKTALRSDRFLDWDREYVATQAGDKRVRLVAVTAGSVTGTILLETGGIPPEATVAIEAERGRPASQGKFLLENCAAGRHYLVITGPSFQKKIVPNVVVRSGSITDVGTVLLGGGRQIRGVVLDEHSKPVMGASVTTSRLILASGTAGAGPADLQSVDRKSIVTDADGAFTITGAGVNGLVAAAEHPELGRSAAVSIPPGGESQSIELRLLSTASLRGRVMRGGVPVSRGVAVAVQSDATANRYTVELDNGSFEFERLPPGKYNLLGSESNSGGDLEAEISVVRLEPGEKRTVDLSLSTVGAEVDVALADGGDLFGAQIYLTASMGAPFQLTKGSQIEDALARLDSGSLRIGHTRPDQPASFTRVKGGTYSLCAVFLPGANGNSEDSLRIRENPGDLPVSCSLLAVDASEKVRKVSLARP